jgi:hypothetical protein
MFYLFLTYVHKHFDLGVAYVSHLYCKSMFQIFHLFQSYVAAIVFMLQVFYLEVAYITMTIDVCCKCMFQIFQLFQTYVTSVLSGCCICCSSYTHMLQAYVSPISDVFYSKCFILQVFSLAGKRKWALAQTVPACVGDPHVHAQQPALAGNSMGVQQHGSSRRACSDSANVRTFGR